MLPLFRLKNLIATICRFGVTTIQILFFRYAKLFIVHRLLRGTWLPWWVISSELGVENVFLCMFQWEVRSFAAQNPTNRRRNAREASLSSMARLVVYSYSLSFLCFNHTIHLAYGIVVATFQFGNLEVVYSYCIVSVWPENKVANYYRYYFKTMYSYSLFLCVMCTTNLLMFL